MNIIILLFVSLLPVILIGLFIYFKDKEKEPKKLLFGLFVSGIGSIILTLILTLIVGIIFPITIEERTNLNLIELIINVFVGVALIEEFSKWIFAYTIGYNHKEYDHIYDMIVYATYVSLGFAALENIIYVLQGGISVGILRALSAVPGHACYGVFMGYFLSLAKIADKNGNKKLSNKNKILSILVPTILHGIYDYCLFSGVLLFIALFFIFVIALYIFAIKHIKKVSSVQTKFVTQNKYCSNCGTKALGNFCENCGNKIN